MRKMDHSPLLDTPRLEEGVLDADADADATLAYEDEHSPRTLEERERDNNIHSDVVVSAALATLTALAAAAAAPAAAAPAAPALTLPMIQPIIHEIKSLNERVSQLYTFIIGLCLFLMADILLTLVWCMT